MSKEQEEIKLREGHELRYFYWWTSMIHWGKTAHISSLDQSGLSLCKRDVQGWVRDDTGVAPLGVKICKQCRRKQEEQ